MLRPKIKVINNDNKSRAGTIWLHFGVTSTYLFRVNSAPNLWKNCRRLEQSDLTASFIRLLVVPPPPPFQAWERKYVNAEYYHALDPATVNPQVRTSIDGRVYNLSLEGRKFVFHAR